MLSSWHSFAGSWRSLIVVATTLTLLSSAGNAWSQDVPTVVQIEEDWELVIADPDAGNAAPQITCTISPHKHLNNLHAVLEVNHKTVPYWAAGGVHLQTWAGEYNLTRRSLDSTAPLSTRGETVRWTTRMSLWNNNLSFAIANGTSTTWGNFGGSTLASSYGTSLNSLNSYSPEFSVRNSGVGFASNRVQSLVLKRVRYRLLNGDVLTDDSPRVVHQSAVQLEPEP